jgi:hypothetical protein
LFTQLIDFAVSLALFNAGNSMPARIAMIAITTKSSMSVKKTLLPAVLKDPDFLEIIIGFSTFARTITKLLLYIIYHFQCRVKRER